MNSFNNCLQQLLKEFMFFGYLALNFDLILTDSHARRLLRDGILILCVFYFFTSKLLFVLLCEVEIGGKAHSMQKRILLKNLVFPISFVLILLVGMMNGLAVKQAMAAGGSANWAFNQA